jgi:hypothetical protein
LQLHDLQNAEAAVPPVKRYQHQLRFGRGRLDLPMKKRHPEKRLEPRAPTPPVRRGMESKAPMVQASVAPVVEMWTVVGVGYSAIP